MDGSPTTPPSCFQSKIVAKSASKQRKHLKLYTEQPPKPNRPPIEAVECLPELLRTFQAATDWPLRYVSDRKSVGDLLWSAPVCVGSGLPADALVLDSPNETERADRPELDRNSVRSLVGSIADLLSELLQTRQVLKQREAELAAGVPLVPHRTEEKHLANRLEAVLRAGAEAVGGDAAALYLLDEATTKLKLRCSWGLPFDRLAAPARPLQGAMADLEALLGHAVVLDDDTLMQTWNVPEDFPAAVCVPISTPTTLLGTLWVFCNQRRDFTDQQTNLLEIVAGRLASDLEREMLLCTAIDGAKLQKQVDAAERLQRSELPTIAPLLDGWNVAGWTSQAGPVGGAFHDWFCLPDGLLAVTVGQADECGIAGALTANAVKTAVRSHARYHRQAERVLPQVNLTLWTGSAGNRRASLFYGLVETATGRVCCSSAGHPSVVRLRGDDCRMLTQSSPSLGEGPESDFMQFGHELQPGDVLVIFTNSTHDVNESALADALRGKLDLAAEELVVVAQAALNPHDDEHHDRSILVVKRTTT